MTVAKIIEMCGGEHAIAYQLEMANIYIVRRWEQRGIPLKNWPVLIRLAKEHGNRLTGEDLWSAVKPLIRE